MNTLTRMVLVVGVLLIVSLTLNKAFADDSQQNCTMVCQTINGTTFCHQICT